MKYFNLFSGKKYKKVLAFDGGGSLAVGDFLILRTIRESNGHALAVDDHEIITEREII